MWRDVGTYIDIVTEFIFNGANFLLGWMIATNGQITALTKNAVIVGVLTGLIGAANHIRALRKAPPL